VERHKVFALFLGRCLGVHVNVVLDGRGEERKFLALILYEIKVEQTRVKDICVKDLTW